LKWVFVVGGIFARMSLEMLSLRVKVEGWISMGDSIMLVCAVLASLAAGVLVAYGVCVGMFAMFRPRRPVVAEQVVLVAGSTSAVEG
jgi:uncharacterized protein (DUF2062 family)